MGEVRDTSLINYIELEEKGTLKAREEEILNLLKDNRPRTDNEIVEELKYHDRNELSPARWRLMKEGLIKSEGKRACKVTGRLAYQWRINNGNN